MKAYTLVPFLLFVLTGCTKKPESSNRTSEASDASGFELFQQDGEFGYKDITGVVAIKPQFAEAGEFSEGLARVKPEALGPWGYLNAAGDMVIPAQFDGASDFHNGKAVVQSNEKFVYIGPDGKSLGYFEDNPSYKPLSVGDTLYVIHPSGLILRAQGNATSDAVGQTQFGDPVVYVYDPHPRQYETIDGFHGSWLSVQYGDKRGYLFDVYLSKFPQAEEKRVVESYKVVVTAANNETYSTYTLTKYLSGGRVSVHEGLDWAESQEIVPRSTVDQVVARMKLFPSGQVGLLLALFDGNAGTFAAPEGDNVAITVQRDAGGFLEHVTFGRKTEEESLDVSVSRYNIHDTETVISSTTTASQQPNQ